MLFGLVSQCYRLPHVSGDGNSSTLPLSVRSCSPMVKVSVYWSCTFSCRTHTQWTWIRKTWLQRKTLTFFFSVLYTEVPWQKKKKTSKIYNLHLYSLEPNLMCDFHILRGIKADRCWREFYLVRVCEQQDLCDGSRRKDGVEGWELSSWRRL